MRELKFRAWDKTYKEMFWWDLSWGESGNQGTGWIYGLPIGEERQIKAFRGDNRKQHDPVDCEIMQFTDLLDRNGKEIYEGDIVNLTLHISPYENCDDDEKSEETIRAIVEFGSGSFWLNGDGYSICTHFHHDDEDREVIGNVWENPELAHKEG